jgi:hypothetical protein
MYWQDAYLVLLIVAAALAAGLIYELNNRARSRRKRKP